MKQEQNKLTLSHNSKTKFSKNHKNTFGLMYGLPENGGSCPGATKGKGGCLDTRDGYKRPTCYMFKVASIYKGVGDILKKNSELVKDKKINELKDIIRNTLNHFVKTSPPDQLYFRLNYSGDIYSLEYAKAWASVMQEFPKIKFWCYTRSFDFVDELVKAKNLSLYLSCDNNNLSKAINIYDKLKDKHINLALAWLGLDAPEQEKYRWIICPETSGKVLNTEDKGACSKCKICIDNYRIRLKNVRFKLH